jgi:transcriptional regulator with XRE-family HTH domain
MKRAYPDLRTFMRETGATQVEIARAAGTTQAVISRLLSGKQRPSLDLALRVAHAANIPVESLGTTERAA